MKQASHETLYAYKARFRQEESSMKAKLGNDVLKHFVTSTERYATETDIKEKQKMVGGAMNRFTAMCYLRGCDRYRYQSLVDDLRSQYTRGNDQYPETIDKAMTLLRTRMEMEKNMEGFKKKQVGQAADARKLQHTLFAPTNREVKAAVRLNVIKNMPVTSEDLGLAEKIFGPDISTLKGRSTRTTPDAVIEDFMEIPPEVTRHQRIVNIESGDFIHFN
ncbi:MAG: hypothetical protein SGBAC_007929 [Bacillariaceae sp.]